MQYRYKLSKNRVKIKNKGPVDLQVPDLGASKKTNFLLDYYAEPLFPKVSRLNTNRLTKILQKLSVQKEIEDGKDSIPSPERTKLTARNFRRNFQLNHIYGHEKDYFKTSWKSRQGDEDFFLGTSALNVKKKLFRSPKTTSRYDRQIVEMTKRYLKYYYEEKAFAEVEPTTGEISFVTNNENDPVMKKYAKDLNKSDAYLYLHFSKKNLFVTLTDEHGKCIKKTSSGAEGLKRREKQKPFAVRLLVSKIAKEIVSKGIRAVTIIFNPDNTYQRWRLKPAMLTLEKEGILINRVQRRVVQQHGGCRRKKSRRI